MTQKKTCCAKSKPSFSIPQMSNSKRYNNFIKKSTTKKPFVWVLVGVFLDFCCRQTKKTLRKTTVNLQNHLVICPAVKTHRTTEKRLRKSVATSGVFVDFWRCWNHQNWRQLQSLLFSNVHVCVCVFLNIHGSNYKKSYLRPGQSTTLTPPLFQKIHGDSESVHDRNAYLNPSSDRIRLHNHAYEILLVLIIPSLGGLDRHRVHEPLMMKFKS